MLRDNPEPEGLSATRVTPEVLSADLVQRLLATAARPRLPVRGEAMRPALRSGDRVTLAGSTRPPARGDLVALRTERGLVVRRYVGISSEGSIVTEDDNVDGFDDPVPEASLVGVVVAVERRGRRVECDAARGNVLRRAAAGLARSCRVTARKLARRSAG